MTSDEAQQIIHDISSIAQSVAAILTLLTEIHSAREKSDREIIDVLKMISRKH